MNLNTTVKQDVVAYDYPFNKDNFGKQLKFSGVNKDIFRIMNFLFISDDMYPDMIFDRWYLPKKAHMLTSRSVIASEMSLLNKTLKDVGISSLIDVGYELDDDYNLFIKFEMEGGTLSVDSRLESITNIDSGISFEKKENKSVD